MYIDTKSNHPPSLIKALPDNISRRISDISSSKEIFDKAAPFYNDALSASGYTEKIVYKENPPINVSNQRNINITWFNPPFSINVTTNIAKKFLLLIDKHFPKKHKFHKLFNRNNVKVSYSCLPNMSSMISSHNKNILTKKEINNTRACNCRRRSECPLDVTSQHGSNTSGPVLLLQGGHSYWKILENT